MKPLHPASQSHTDSWEKMCFFLPGEFPCPCPLGQHHTRFCKEEPENPDWSQGPRLLLLEPPVYSNCKAEW